MDNASWKVKKKLFVWERPLRKSDLRALGDDAPTADPGRPRGAHRGEGGAPRRSAGLYFTTPHFDGYPIVLVKLDEIPWRTSKR